MTGNDNGAFLQHLHVQLDALSELCGQVFSVPTDDVVDRLARFIGPTAECTSVPEAAKRLSALLTWLHDGILPGYPQALAVTPVMVADPAFGDHIASLSKSMVALHSTWRGNSTDMVLNTRLKEVVGPVTSLDIEGWYQRCRYQLDTLIPSEGDRKRAAKVTEGEAVPPSQLAEWKAAKRTLLDEIAARVSATNRRGTIQAELCRVRGPVNGETLEGMHERVALLRQLFPTREELEAEFSDD